MANGTKIALVLVGGKGTRLWPLSRENYPKQFVEFKNGQSLFQLTLRRLLSYFAPEDVFFVAQESYEFTIANQIELTAAITPRAKKILLKNLIFEPQAKNTLPAIILSLKYIQQKSGLKAQDTIFVFPSDHIIAPLSAFKKCLQQSVKIAARAKLVVFGVKPTQPKEGYGYIICRQRFGQAFLVKKFIEKPDTQKAKALIRQGAFWNAGIFCFTSKTFAEELKKYQPKIYQYYRLPYLKLAKTFAKIPADSLDYALMQKTKRAALVKFGLHWSDLGSWDTFLRYALPSGENQHIGKAEFINARGCFTYAKDKLVTVVGLNDVMAIDMRDALLLIKKGNSDKVKELFALLARKKYPQSKEGLTVYRPWGYYTVLHEAPLYKVKEIGVYAKKFISLQRHCFRSEHWNIVAGEAEITVGRKKLRLRRNQSIYVPKNTKHKVYNPSKEMLKIIEVQIGTYLGEDDIKRFDQYRRSE